MKAVFVCQVLGHRFKKAVSMPVAGEAATVRLPIEAPVRAPRPTQRHNR